MPSRPPSARYRRALRLQLARRAGGSVQPARTRAGASSSSTCACRHDPPATGGRRTSFAFTDRSRPLSRSTAVPHASHRGPALPVTIACALQRATQLRRPPLRSSHFPDPPGPTPGPELAARTDAMSDQARRLQRDRFLHAPASTVTVQAGAHHVLHRAPGCRVGSVRARVGDVPHEQDGAGLHVDDLERERPVDHDRQRRGLSRRGGAHPQRGHG